jgi:biopolymer transport protein ExbB
MRLAVASTRTRPTAVVGGLLTFLLCALLATYAAPVRAQEKENKENKENPPAANNDGGDTAKADDGASSSSAGKTNLFAHIVKSVGWGFGLLLLAMSILLVTLIVLLSMDLRLGNAIPPGFVEDFTETVNKRQFKQAYEMARDDSSYLGRVLTTGMARLQYGIEDARESAFNMVDSIKASKEQGITYLATIGTLGPMIGLVGTVWGMILSFMELGTPGKTPRPDKLADGISHALVVTLLGIALSVPAIFFHAMFRNRLIRMSMDTSNVADDLLTQMYHNSKRPAAVATAEPANDRATPPAGIKSK